MKTKKRLMFLVMALLVINVFSSSILASDVAYIYKNRGQIDRNIIDVLSNQRYELALIFSGHNISLIIRRIRGQNQHFISRFYLQVVIASY